tara:strand:- start:16 stop:243 length:228 start_codon:yes stop_codon:yes gene_type:complete
MFNNIVRRFDLVKTFRINAIEKNSNDVIIVPVAKIANGTCVIYLVSIYSLITGVPIAKLIKNNINESEPKKDNGL